MTARRAPAILAALAVLFAGLTNAHAHLHLCLEALETPAVVHAHTGHIGGHDYGHGHDDDEHGDHHDLDVELRDASLAKTLKFKPDLPAFDAAPVATLPLTLRAVVPPAADGHTVTGADAPFLRPPSRAPPPSSPT